MWAQMIKFWEKKLSSTYLSTSISSAVYLWPWGSLACTALIVCGLSFKEKSGPNGKNVLTGWFGLAAVDFSFWDDFETDSFSASALKQIKMHFVYDDDKNIVIVQLFLCLVNVPTYVKWNEPKLANTLPRKNKFLMPAFFYFPVQETTKI